MKTSSFILLSATWAMLSACGLEDHPMTGIYEQQLVENDGDCAWTLPRVNGDHALVLEQNDSYSVPIATGVSLVSMARFTLKPEQGWASFIPDVQVSREGAPNCQRAEKDLSVQIIRFSPTELDVHYREDWHIEGDCNLDYAQPRSCFNAQTIRFTFQYGCESVIDQVAPSCRPTPIFRSE